MQNPISYHSLRSLFVPVERPSEKNHMQTISKPSNILTQIMPIEQVMAGISHSYGHQIPIYITVKRKIANLNTKDILFGIFKTDFSLDEKIVFEDVDNNIIRLLAADDILSIRCSR